MSETQKRSRVRTWMSGILRTGLMIVGFTGYVVALMAVAGLGIWMVTSGRADMVSAALVTAILNTGIQCMAISMCF